jgi:ABC-type branched-subunit amino acid transport system substrate-binding protein
MSKQTPSSSGVQRRDVLALALAATAPLAQAQSKTPGVSDKQILLGNIVPYSGPLAAYGCLGAAMLAYFDKVNDQGGINGRKVKVLSLDDAYSPPKTVEQARKLVEQEEVLLLGGCLGTAPNIAIQKYMNAKKVPQIFIHSGVDRWNDPKHFPYTIGFQPSNRLEGRIYAKHILQTNPNARIAALFQNDDIGKDYMLGFKEGLGDRAKALLVGEASYEVTDPTADSQLVQLKSTGADTFFNVSTLKVAAQSIRKVAEMRWKPTQYLGSISVSINAVLRPAGFENAQGIISSTFFREPLDPRWKDDKDVAEYLAWMKTYYPKGDVKESLNAVAYCTSQCIEQALRQCGNDLSRANVMRQVASLDMSLPMLMPGMRVKTGPDDFAPLKQLQMMRFSGSTYEPLGAPISA